MNFDINNDLLIIPDVHGRTFWRYAVENMKYSHVVFLGDYIDPYPQEGIRPVEAFKMLIEIVNFAKDNPDTCTLLLGNHDMHYMSADYASKATGSRFSYALEEAANCLFCENEELFSLAFEADFGPWHCLLTHAGITKQWYLQHRDIIGDLTAENLNKLTQSKEGIDTLTDIGMIRGGFSPTGSMVWADYDEVVRNGRLPGIYQIFGHTQSVDRRVRITRHVACVDCQKPLMLSEVLAVAAKVRRNFTRSS